MKSKKLIAVLIAILSLACFLVTGASCYYKTENGSESFTKGGLTASYTYKYYYDDFKTIHYAPFSVEVKAEVTNRSGTAKYAEIWICGDYLTGGNNSIRPQWFDPSTPIGSKYGTRFWRSSGRTTLDETNNVLSFSLPSGYYLEEDGRYRVVGQLGDECKTINFDFWY